MWWLKINNKSCLMFAGYEEAAYHAIEEIKNNPNKNITIEIFEGNDTRHS